jgi:hypothetical protein
MCGSPDSAVLFSSLMIVSFPRLYSFLDTPFTPLIVQTQAIPTCLEFLTSGFIRCTLLAPSDNQSDLLSQIITIWTYEVFFYFNEDVLVNITVRKDAMGL